MSSEIYQLMQLISLVTWGEIWVTPTAHNGLLRFGEFEPVMALSLSDEQQPKSFYRLANLVDTYRFQPSFEDRSESLSTLRKYLARLKNEKQGQTIFVGNDAGIGKSRLWDKLRSQPEAQEMYWLTGHCQSQQEPYQLWADLLHHYLKLDAG